MRPARLHQQSATSRPSDLRHRHVHQRFELLADVAVLRVARDADDFDLLIGVPVGDFDPEPAADRIVAIRKELLDERLVDDARPAARCSVSAAENVRPFTIGNAERREEVRGRRARSWRAPSPARRRQTRTRSRIRRSAACCLTSDDIGDARQPRRSAVAGPREQCCESAAGSSGCRLRCVSSTVNDVPDRSRDRWSAGCRACARTATRRTAGPATARPAPRPAPGAARNVARLR